MRLALLGGVVLLWDKRLVEKIDVQVGGYFQFRVCFLMLRMVSSGFFHRCMGQLTIL
jgi:hypothetical protein